jgi:alpha-L-rhamnosidase
LLQQGGNAIGAMLGDGWYSGHVEFRGRQRYGDRPKLLAQLVVTFEDGATQLLSPTAHGRRALGQS